MLKSISYLLNPDVVGAEVKLTVTDEKKDHNQNCTTQLYQATWN